MSQAVQGSSVVQAKVVPGDPISTPEKREIFEKVLRSRSFQRAPKLREFLRLVCERAFSSDEAESLREQDIGRAVYHRAADYNSSEDNIVRVEARNLRRKLDDFFSDEGKDLPLVITIPRGAYVPQFERRALMGPDPAAARVPQVEPVPPAVLSPAPIPRPYRFASAALIPLLALVCAWLLWQNSRLRSQIAPVAPPPAIWSALFDEHHDTYLVLSDSGYVVVQDILRKNLTLADYLKRDHGAIFHGTDPRNERERAAEIVGLPQFTSVAGARFVASVEALKGVPKNRLSVRYARELEPRDLKGNHVILLGSARSNPWVESFLPKLNFQQEFDFRESRAVIRNKVPLPGESPMYRAGEPGDDTNDLYSTIAFLPSLNGNGNVLIVSGTGTIGTEAAGDLLFDANLTEQMIRQLHLLHDGHLRFFEVLLKSSRLGSTFEGLQVVAHRIIGE
jgi:hypothetical protein